MLNVFHHTTHYILDNFYISRDFPRNFLSNVLGNIHSANGIFIKSQLHALLVAEEIDPFELENLALSVVALDPGILQPLNTLLWKKWVKGWFTYLTILLEDEAGKRIFPVSMPASGSNQFRYFSDVEIA